MTRPDYIKAARRTSIYTNHANLVYMYDPVGKNPGSSKHTANKLSWWALKLKEFRFIIEHITGEDNLWADMLTGWTVHPRNKVALSRIGKVKTFFATPICPHTNEKYYLPNRKDIKPERLKHMKTKPNYLTNKCGIWLFRDGNIWIPEM